MLPWPFTPLLRPVSKIFHSLELDGPFRKCLKCDGDLHKPGIKYSVERIFCREEPIIEYAMCDRCQLAMSSELSESSLAAIQEIFRSVDDEARMNELASHLDGDDINPWIDKCYITGKARSECRSYQIVGRFEAAEIELQMLPIMLSDDAVEMITERLSKQTRDQFDDFMDNFTMPPEFSAEPDFTPLLI